MIYRTGPAREGDGFEALVLAPTAGGESDFRKCSAVFLPGFSVAATRLEFRIPLSMTKAVGCLQPLLRSFQDKKATGKI
jgi:hypothetical protein